MGNCAKILCITVYTCFNKALSYTFCQNEKESYRIGKPWGEGDRWVTNIYIIIHNKVTKSTKQNLALSITLFHIVTLTQRDLKILKAQTLLLYP